MSRRVKSLHHNLQEGQNVVYHREHRSKKNQSPLKRETLQKFDRKHRRKFKAGAKIALATGFYGQLDGRRRK